MAQRIPHISEPLYDADTQKINDNWHRFLDGLSTDLGGAESTLTGKASVTQSVCASFTFKAPEDETVRLILKAPFAWTITETITRTEVGTATVTTKIDGVALGGTANSASTSEQSQAHASANVVDAGDDVEVTFASTSSDCENLCLTIAGTRTLDE